jgi:hypothetical protein
MSCFPAWSCEIGQPLANETTPVRAENLFYTNPQFTALAEKTLYAGLRRAGFLDE